MSQSKQTVEVIYVKCNIIISTSMQIKENMFKKVVKIFSPNRDVILYSFSIDLIHTLIMKHLKL